MNSAAPAPSSGPIGDVLKAARDWYSSRDLPLVVRVTPLVAHVDARLEVRGFTREGLTDVMVADLDVDGTPPDSAIETEPRPQWLEAQAELQGVPAHLIGSWKGTIGRIAPPAGFALLRDGAVPIAVGLAVRDESWMGLFEINVAAAYRRRGLGRRLSSALLQWGAAAGVERAYLQVVRDNQPARVLYRSLGFKPAYSYWYRRAPAH